MNWYLMIFWRALWNLFQDLIEVSEIEPGESPVPPNDSHGLLFCLFVSYSWPPGFVALGFLLRFLKADLATDNLSLYLEGGSKKET